ncbi:hypothetical protein M422DRAFT_272608 [Sphaerobolus stellatus SS14]|uniref:DUF5648 domain-containing protein n=1 Tax=Sphaerobolus stellatus (strain SS14) TaxID=990650 RepID=A0A0C9UM10_SPHS4|nr:hypothetical protein M422DRAFT_272608 [Sphaerobolus stellatus SS14]
MENFIHRLLSTLLLICISVTCRAATLNNSSDQRRAADTCADPTLADVWVEAYNPSLTAHIIRSPWVFVASIAMGLDWQFQGPVFRAWENPQEFTVPLYEFNKPDNTDILFLPSTDGNPPTVAGYENSGITGYVYATQVCGSVPLLVAANAATTDHWYTTNVLHHSSIVASGWTDEGVAAFVLPLTSGKLFLLVLLNQSHS